MYILQVTDNGIISSSLGFFQGYYTHDGETFVSGSDDITHPKIKRYKTLYRAEKTKNILLQHHTVRTVNIVEITF